MHLMRIEGVNLVHSFGDTEDLSTRRGGGLMLLDAINAIKALELAGVTSISTGASAGLFQLHDECDQQAIISKVDTLLRTHPYCHGTFVVDLLSGDKDFPEMERHITAKNRWQQMQCLSFSTVGLAPSPGGCCEGDEVRPATQSMFSAGRQVASRVSESVHARRTHGIGMRNKLYASLLGDTPAANASFAQHFHQIADEANDLTLEPASLRGKLAIFYADGNSFGTIGQSCTSPDELSEWDKYVKAQRKQFLHKLLEDIQSLAHWKNSDTLRLETLLWGGDELMFAVPGWCGLELADRFFTQSSTMRYPNDDSGKPLTHACGLVFCHMQAPISRVSNLAKALAEEGKNRDRNRNSLNWVVLESFDHTGTDLNDYLKKRFGKRHHWGEFSLTHDGLRALMNDFAPLRSELPRSAIVEVARALAENRAFDADGTIMPLVKRAYTQIGDKGGNTFASLWELNHPRGRAWSAPPAADDLGAWIKLAELWDYAGHGPARAVTSNTQSGSAT